MIYSCKKDITVCEDLQDRRYVIMSGSSRQTGTVPKTKHNTRSRRENTVNHIPNNLDWHEAYPCQRTRKESNTASRLSDHGDEYEENPWIGLPQQRNESEEVRWQNVKSSNLTPERSGSLTNVDSLVSSLPSCSTSRRQENSSLEEPSTSKEAEKMRLKQKIEMSQRKIDELQHQQAAYLSMRNKAIQQVKPVQVEEIHQNQTLGPLRCKVIQQAVKPIQQGDMDQMANLERRLQSIQEYTNLIQAIEHDDSMLANFEGGGDCPMDQQLRFKLEELINKKARMDNLLAYFESNKVVDGARSVSSEEGDSSGTSYLRQYLLEQADQAKRDSNKQDNRENPSSYTPTRETRLEGLRMKVDQFLDWMSRVENQNVNGPKSSPRVNGDGASAQLLDVPQTQNKILQPSRDKPQQAKKLTLDNARRPKSNPAERTNGLSISNMESWSIRSNMSSASHNQAQSSSDEGEYDESPVKLCPPNLTLPHQFNYGKPFGSFGSGLENTFSAPSSLSEKCIPTLQGKTIRGDGVSRSECDGAMEVGRPNMVGSIGRAPPRTAPQPRQYPPNPAIPPHPPGPPPPPPDPATMAMHLTQLQEQMQAVYEGLVEKLAAYHPPPPPPPAPWLGAASSLGYLQFMSPSSQWHQHQLLISSLNQCCQLIWHQQREIAGLRQALNMVQREDERVCEDGCQAYGHNLNPGLLWQPPLNNQVAPGNRANNYWDNFRSYSRQNLLSARNKSNERGRPTSSQSDNLRRVENSCSTNTRSVRNGENFCDPNYFGAREMNMSKIKHEHGNDAFSLEQSVYSELESVIMQPERSPDLLLQLLSQLKTIKSQQALSQDGIAYEEVNTFDAPTPGCSRQSNPVEVKPSTSLHPEDNKSIILDEVAKLITGGAGHQVCTPEFLQRLVELTSRALLHHESAQTTLEASLLKFQGARLTQVAEELLCVIANVLSVHYPNDLADPQVEVEDNAGGSVGVSIPLPVHHHAQLSSPQSVETELAEADQRSSSDNAQVFDVHEIEAYNEEPESGEQNHTRDEASLSSDVSGCHDLNQPKD